MNLVNQYYFLGLYMYVYICIIYVYIYVYGHVHQKGFVIFYVCVTLLSKIE